jgi:hypothetical protein
MDDKVSFVSNDDIDKKIIELYYNSKVDIIDNYRKLYIKNKMIYKLVYDTTIIDIDTIISRYYLDTIPIGIVFITPYVDRETLCRDKTIHYDSIYDVELYNINDNINGTIELIIKDIDNKDKWLYGCRCKKDHCKHNYVEELKLDERYCCNIFKLNLNKLCNKCFGNLVLEIKKLVIKYYCHPFLILNNDIYDIFISRFKNLINYFLCESYYFSYKSDDLCITLNRFNQYTNKLFTEHELILHQIH